MRVVEIVAKASVTSERRRRPAIITATTTRTPEMREDDANETPHPQSLVVLRGCCGFGWEDTVPEFVVVVSIILTNA